MALGLALVLGLVVAAVVVAAGGEERTSFVAATVPEPRLLDPPERAYAAAGCRFEQLPSEGELETGGKVVYRADPPHSGSHRPQPAPDKAFYTDPPETEALVHSLYHGRVVLWFSPSLSEEEKGALKALWTEDSNHVTLVPRDSMEFPVAATAWTKRLLCPEFNDRVYDALRAFRDTHRDQAPEFTP